jgi:hypothetical protein
MLWKRRVSYFVKGLLSGVRGLVVASRRYVASHYIHYTTLHYMVSIWFVYTLYSDLLIIIKLYCIALQ